ncbi:hypothetical protein BTO06_16750 [Tenacibaculum sp. SZ-18]|uniref:hypothetical protein n=1 Tax=Tenacibaculum sp. SZ-18 TaxID=754423 RepID=UPI000C2D20B6|nr:hypothetical protein [Tenacibaculum sp. SZ-18]AUC16694.1 hypothetical protein BTO06_16750 [Tenacibaculum sp. SZ-18]
MKYVRLVILSMTLILLSCSEEKESLQMLETFEKEKVITNQSIKSNSPKGISIPYSILEEENMMYMTSYLIGLTLLNDHDAREYLFQELNGKEQKISLRTLLSNDKNSFKLAFRSEYLKFNWGTTPKGEPTPPVSSAIPDPLKRNYGVLTIDFDTYLHQISNTYDWDIHAPNKDILFGYLNFSQYLNHKQYLINLWDMDTGLYDDGLKMSDTHKDFIPSYFDYTQELNDILILTLRNPGTYSI